VVDVCDDETAKCHRQMSAELSAACPSQCVERECSSERSSPEVSVNKTAKCPNPDAAPQKTSKELAKVKKREDKGIGKLRQ